MLVNNDYEIEKTMYVEPNVDTMMKPRLDRYPEIRNDSE